MLVEFARICVFIDNLPFELLDCVLLGDVGYIRLQSLSVVGYIRLQSLSVVGYIRLQSLDKKTASLHFVHICPFLIIQS